MAGRTVSNGYGVEHKRLRAEWKPHVDRLEVDCWRCGELIIPNPDILGEGWDLGHDDEERGIYHGPEHVSCNRATNGPSRATATTGRKQERPSRRWVLDGCALDANLARLCPICGAVCTRYRTCSRACGVELRRRNAPPPLVKTPKQFEPQECAECASTFTPTVSNQVTCSRVCGSDRNRRRNREHYQNDPTYHAVTLERAKQRRERQDKMESF
jgi:hypothetical protein